MGITSSGSTARTRAFLDKMKSPSTFYSSLEGLAQQGVAALSSATPVESGLTAGSWGYEIESSGGKTTISWLNTNRDGTVQIAVILQYGHGTGTGGWVSGRDYINPAIQPVMNRIADEVWRKVTSA